MPKQSEQILEELLITNLQKLGYQYVPVSNESALVQNLKLQLEKHNNVCFSISEFDKVLNILNKGSVFEKAKTLRQKPVTGDFQLKAHKPKSLIFLRTAFCLFSTG